MLEELRRFMDAATPGPWRVAGGYNIKHELANVATTGQADNDQAAADAALIAATRNALPALLALAEAAQAIVLVEANVNEAPTVEAAELAYIEMREARQALRTALAALEATP